MPKIKATNTKQGTTDPPATCPPSLSLRRGGRVARQEPAGDGQANINGHQ